eukprot:1663402-Amphidinium_carterae.1
MEGMKRKYDAELQLKKNRASRAADWNIGGSQLHQKLQETQQALLTGRSTLNQELAHERTMPLHLLRSCWLWEEGIAWVGKTHPY